MAGLKTEIAAAVAEVRPRKETPVALAEPVGAALAGCTGAARPGRANRLIDQNRPQAKAEVGPGDRLVAVPTILEHGTPEQIEHVPPHHAKRIPLVSAIPSRPVRPASLRTKAVRAARAGRLGQKV